MECNTIKRTVLEDAWLAVVQLIGEHELAGLDVRRLRSLERELRTVLDFDNGERVAA